MMAEDLDALFELFEDDEEQKQHESDKTLSTNAVQQKAAEGAALAAEANQDGHDMLLFLADECATEPHTATGCADLGRSARHATTSATPGSHPSQAVVRHAAAPALAGNPASTNNISTRNPGTAPYNRMCQSKAFSSATGVKSAVNNLNNSNNRLGGTSGAHSSSSAGTAVTKQPSSNECQHFVEKLTGLKIKNPRVSGIVLRERYKQFAHVQLSKARDHVAVDGQHWVVIGVLVSKTIATTSQGAPYSRWRLSDLAGNDTWVSLFGDAHKDNYAEAEGSILAFYNPKFSFKGPGSSSSNSGLAVSQSHQVELLATSLGWGICKGKTRSGARCNNAVDTTVSCFCQYHAIQQAKTLKKPAAVAAGGVRAGLGLAAAAAGSAGSTPAVAAASNGKVFDARSNSWSSVTAPAAAAAAPGSGGSGSSSLSKLRGSSSIKQGGSSGGSSSSSSRTAVGSCSRQQQPPTASAAANTQQHSDGPPQQQQQDKLREVLRQRLQQQQQQGPNCSATPVRRPAASAAGPGRSAGFSLKSLITTVESDGRQQQQQQQGDGSSEEWMLQSTDQQQHSTTAAGRTVAPAAAADGSTPLEMEQDERLVKPNSSGGGQLAAAAAAPTASELLAAREAAPAAAAGPMARLAATSSSSGVRSSGNSMSVGGGVKAAANAQKRMRADLGLGPKPGGSSSSNKAGSGSSKPPHVSRVGPVGAKPAAAAAAGGSSSNRGFKAAFGRVLQRADINKPDAKLLDAAADQKHAAMMSKMLAQYEQKDQLAQQLEGITKLQVTAFECRTCKALTEKRRASCSGHDIVAVRVMKRWWTCDACGWKVHTLREMFPSKRCPKCRDPGAMYTAASAYNAPKVQTSVPGCDVVASREGVLPRGTEHAFCLQNSL